MTEKSVLIVPFDVEAASGCKPRLVEILPSNPVVGQKVAVRCYYLPGEQWVLESPGENIVIRGNKPGRVECDNIEFSGAKPKFVISTTFSIKQLRSAIAETFLLDENFHIYSPRGSVITRGLSVSGGCLWGDRIWYGTAQIEYETQSYRDFWWYPKYAGVRWMLFREVYSEKVEYFSITVAPSEEAGTNPAAVYICVRDFCTGSTLEGAGVIIDNVYKGQTDQNGMLYVGIQQPGLHNIKVTASNYIDTDCDSLDNDTFQV